ncbi:MAG: hypothetical protein AB8G05_11385 [Oligoflexales bacterium]
MGLSSYRIASKFFLIAALFTLEACLKRQVESPLRQSQGQNQSLQQIKPLSKLEPVKGARLKTDSLDLGTIYAGTHGSLNLTTSPDPDADYLEYTICQVETGTCEPGPDAPGVMTSLSYSIPKTTTGLIEVSVRSCARANKTIERKDTCGPWITKKYLRSPNEYSDISNLLIQFQKQEEIIRQECKKIHNNIEAYFEENETDLTNSQSVKSQQFFDLLRNNLVVGEDRCTELHLNNMLGLVESDFSDSNPAEAQNTSLKLTEEKQRNVGAALILTVGSLAFMHQSYELGSKLLTLKKLNSEIERISTDYTKTLSSIQSGVSFSSIRRTDLNEVFESHSRLEREIEAVLEQLQKSETGKKLNKKLIDTYPKTWDQDFFRSIMLEPKPDTLYNKGLETDPFNNGLPELEEFRTLFGNKIDSTRARIQEMTVLQKEYSAKASRFFDGTDVRDDFRATLLTDLSKHSENIKKIDNSFYQEVAERTNRDISELRREFDGANKIDNQLISKKTQRQKIKDVGFRPGITRAIIGALVAGIAYSSLNLSQNTKTSPQLLEKLDDSYELISNSIRIRNQITNSIEKESSP